MLSKNHVMLVLILSSLLFLGIGHSSLSFDAVTLIETPLFSLVFVALFALFQQKRAEKKALNLSSSKEKLTSHVEA